MGTLRDISVKIEVASIPWSPSVDPVYLGVYGKETGGREFAIDVKGYKEFDKEGKVVRFALGSGCCPEKTDLQVKASTGGGHNDPEVDNIDLEDVEYVYLRKLLRDTEAADDRLVLSSIDVLMFDDKGSLRRFKKDGELYFAHEAGVQHWLVEDDPPNCRIQVILDSIYYGGKYIGKRWEYELKAEVGSQSQTISGSEKIKHETTKYIYPKTTASRNFVLQGCCGTEYKVKLYARLEERDFWEQNYVGDEDEELTVKCVAGDDFQTNFEINVKVHARFNKTAEMQVKGRVIATCTE